MIVAVHDCSQIRYATYPPLSPVVSCWEAEVPHPVIYLEVNAPALVLWSSLPCQGQKQEWMSSLACLFLPICFGLLLIPGLHTDLLVSSSWNVSFALTVPVDCFIISSLHSFGPPCSKRTFRYNVTKQLLRNKGEEQAKPCPGDCFTHCSL